MKNRSIAACIALAICLVGLLAVRWPGSPYHDGGNPVAVDVVGAGNTSSAAPLRAEKPPASFATVAEEEELKKLRRGLSAATSREDRARLLSQWRSDARRNPAKTSIAIQKFLVTGVDAPADGGFALNANGFLDEAPTLRVLLLDLLGSLDPAAAEALSRVILQNKTSADEWAVAMRNLARDDGGAEAMELLEGKLRELLNYEPWQRDQSAGFLEAFDVAVFLGGTNLVPELTSLVRKSDTPAIAHAAYLALDRMVQHEPAAMFGVLLDHPELMQGRDKTRADFFARADVRDPEQRAALERYLASPGMGSVELQQFAGVFPNANYMLSHNLLTSTPTPDARALAERDSASLQAVEEWMGDPRFKGAAPYLDRCKARLREFVGQRAK